MFIPYRDTVTIYEVVPDEYGRSKDIASTSAVSAIFLQSIKIRQSGSQDTIDADAIVYLDPDDTYIQGKSYRLEGMYLRAPIYDSASGDNWYCIESVTVNRDHLLSNQIDNILCILSKSEKLVAVS